MSAAIVFPGQGAQTVGMGQQVAGAFPEAREVFERADAALGFSLSTLCFEGPQDELNRTEISQPAIYTASAAIRAAYVARHGALPEASVTAGLSLGEYTALFHAGAIDFEAGLQLVRARGVAMQAACDAQPSGMLSIIGLDRAAVERIVAEAGASGVICLANINSAMQIAVSGSHEALAVCARLAEEAEAMRVIELQVAGAFHSPLMAPARDQLAEAVASAPIVAPRIPVVSNVTAGPVSDPEQIRGLLLDQLTSPVEWVRSIEGMIAGGAATFYELGPGKVLTGLLKRIDRKVKGVAISTVEPVEND